jgi:hypothetical protein
LDKGYDNPIAVKTPFRGPSVRSPYPVGSVRETSHDNQKRRNWRGDEVVERTFSWLAPLSGNP